MSFLTGYSLAAILGGSCLGIVLTVLALAPVLRRRSKAPELPSEPSEALAWAEPGRPGRCARCGSTELVFVPGLSLLARERSADTGPLAHTPTRPLQLEVLACAGCGRAEWFVDSPQALAPFRGRPALGARPPYRS
jgi:hypothetical protein